MEENNKINSQSSKVMAGIIIVAIGAFLLLDNMGLHFPRWFFNWSNILIVIGLYISVKHNFRNNNGLILIIVGSFFTLKKALDQIYDFDKIGWPVLIIILGLFLIFKPKGNSSNFKNRRRDIRDDKFSSSDGFAENTDPELKFNTNQDKKGVNIDFLDSINFFAGSHLIVYSKNFKGGQITSVFGGCDVNLTQADFDGQIEIDVTAIFGGAKIIVPAGWQIKQEVTAIFGGFDDKRAMNVSEGSNKILVIKGIALFGGVDIRSY